MNPPQQPTSPQDDSEALVQAPEKGWVKRDGVRGRKTRADEEPAVEPSPRELDE